MRKILLLSDTHSYIDDDILKYVKQADEVWHAGDIGDLKVTDAIKKLKPLKAVYGNIDNDKARLEFSENNRFMCEGVDVWMTHIGGYPNRYDMKIREEIKKKPTKTLYFWTFTHSKSYARQKTKSITYESWRCWKTWIS